MLIVASSGLTLNKHYCMGELRSVAIHKHAPNCYELIGEDGDMEMDCCENTSDLYQVDDEQQLTKLSVDLKPDLKLVASVTFFLLDLAIIDAPSNQSEYLNYKPPLIAQDVPVLVQSFLL